LPQKIGGGSESIPGTGGFRQDVVDLSVGRFYEPAQDRVRDRGFVGHVSGTATDGWLGMLFVYGHGSLIGNYYEYIYFQYSQYFHGRESAMCHRVGLSIFSFATLVFSPQAAILWGVSLH
jgi:hypothetical protein